MREADPLARCVVHHLTLAILIPATLLLAVQWNRLEVTAALWAMAMVALEIVWIPHLMRNAMPSPAMMVNLTAGFGILAAGVVPSLWLPVAVAAAVGTGMLLALNFRLPAAVEATALVAVLAIALLSDGSPPFPPLWLLAIVVALAVADTFGWLLSYGRWAENAMHRRLVESGATVWDVDRHGRITDLVGTPLDGVSTGDQLVKLVHPDDIDALRGEQPPALGGSAEFRLRNGHDGWTWVREVPIRDNDSFGARRSRVVDTSSERSRTEELRGMATRDPLTNCANRSAHEAELANRRDAARLSLVKIELEGLDGVVDTLGYDVGDRVLAACSDRIRVQCTGHHLARVGADQFAIVADLDAAAVADLARRVHEQITTPFSVGGAQATVGAVIGTATLAAAPQADGEPRPPKIPGPDLDTITHRADQAVRHARANGESVVAFESSLAPAASENAELSKRVIGAFRQGEIGVYHQPIVKLSSSGDDPILVGTETLARWTHPELGVLEPGRFLAVLDVGGHHRRLSRIVLEDSLRDLAAEAPAPSDRFVAVNLDAVNLLDVGLARWLGDRLERHGIDAARLVLEIKADELASLPSKARTVLSEVTELGVRVCADRLDIAAVGLGVLADLPISEVKIASDVLVEAARDEQVGSLVDSAIESARQLGLTVTAVGVENRATLTAVTELGCDRAQGHELGRPIPVGELDVRDDVSSAAPTGRRPSSRGSRREPAAAG